MDGTLYSIGPVQFLILLSPVLIFFVAVYIALKKFREKTAERRKVFSSPPPTSPPTNETDWDEVWREAVANGIDPLGQDGQGLLRTIRKRTGNPNWNPPTT